MPEPPEQASDGPSPSGGAPPDDEPSTAGTLFIMILFLMALVGMWILMYLRLVEM